MSTHLQASNDYEQILLRSSGLLDVRAPIEFKQGAFPKAANLPLLNDQERHQVGALYKQHGQDRAIQLGYELVSGNTKQHRVEQWISFSKQHQNAYLYCFRGGLRSRISQQWLQEAGIEITRVLGGYKALRRFLVKQLETADQHFDFILIGGLTGCRKTKLTQELSQGIDLENAAYHRGSSFGAHATPQSSQINFENQIAIELLKFKKSHHQLIALEDEGRFIGSVDIPKNIYSKMRLSPLVVVERSFQARLQQLLQEYVVDMEQEFLITNEEPEEAFQEFSNYLLESLLRIRKRLGMARWHNLDRLMRAALLDQKTQGDISPHLAWIEPLLTDYYDPMYLSQLEKRKEHVVFRGQYEDCQQYLTSASQSNY